MRRHVATFVAAALLLASVVGPVAAGAGSRPSGAMADGTGDAAAEPADPSGRWIVVYKGGTDAIAATKARSVRVGFRADRTFSHGIRGFAAALTEDQVQSLRHDRDVAAVVPDERIEVEAQANPTGISRIGGLRSEAARVNGTDERVDADVAILDTGIAKVPDLNVAGGYDCSTSNPARWRDVYGHGTHVAGTVGAIDNDAGVVGVAPGVRLWAVKVIDDSGSGLLSWYACGIDWVFAQRDPNDPSKPLIEAVNMSITKWGEDDGACGTHNDDPLHGAICRLVDSGVTVVAAAANDSGNAARRVPGSYDEVITVSALADTDGRAGGLGGNKCFSWGSYDNDDTFADFSNYGSDVDLIAPGKCIYSTMPGGGFAYMSGTSMAAPHVTGAAALLKSARPYLTPAEVKEALQYLGTVDWKVTSDPDGTHEKLLDVSQLGLRGDFGVSVPNVASVPSSGGMLAMPVTLSRSASSFERVQFRSTHLPRGVRATFATKSLYGFTDLTTTMDVKVSSGTPPGTYHLTVVADEHGNAHEVTATFQVTGPAAPPPPTTNQPPRGLTEKAPPGPRTVVTGTTGVHAVNGTSVPGPRSATPDAGTSPTGQATPDGLDVTGEPAAPGAGPGASGDATHPPHTLVPLAKPPVAFRPLASVLGPRAPHQIRPRNTFVIAC